MISFNYKLDENDYFAFNQYHLETSSMGKKALLTFSLIIPSICIMLFIIFLGAGANSFVIISEAILLSIISILWIIFAKKIYLSSIKSNIKKLRKHGKLPFSNEGTLVFDEEFINDISSLTEVKTRYSSVEKIGITETAIYIYISAMQAYIVPQTCFKSEEEMKNLLNFLASKINTNNCQLHLQN